MSDDALVRCSWATFRPGPDFELYRNYHDREWGRQVRDGVALFERMSLEAFQSGLSWLIILRKRENFRRAFHRFDAERIARYTKRDIDRLGLDAIAQVNLGVRAHRNRPLVELGVMSRQVIATLLSRCGIPDSGVGLTQFVAGEGYGYTPHTWPVSLADRPPMQVLRPR